MKHVAAPVEPPALQPPLKIIKALEQSEQDRSTLEELADFFRGWSEIADQHRTATARVFRTRCSELINRFEGRIEGFRSAVTRLPDRCSGGNPIDKAAVVNNLQECWELLGYGPTYVSGTTRIAFRTIAAVTLLLLILHQMAIVSRNPWAAAKLGLSPANVELAWTTCAVTVVLALVAAYKLKPSVLSFSKWGLVAALCVGDWVHVFPGISPFAFPAICIVGFVAFTIVEDHKTYRGTNRKWDDAQLRKSLNAGARHASGQVIPRSIPEMRKQSDLMRDAYIWMLLRAAHDNPSRLKKWLIRAQDECDKNFASSRPDNIRNIELVSRKEIMRTFAANESDIAQSLSLENFDRCLHIIFAPVLCEYEMLDSNSLNELIVAILNCFADENRLYTLYADHEQYIGRLYARSDLREEVKRIAYPPQSWSDRSWCLHFLTRDHPGAIGKLREHVEHLISHSGSRIAAAAELERRSGDAVRAFRTYLTKVADESDVSDQEKLDEWFHLFRKVVDANATLETAKANLPDFAGHLNHSVRKGLTKGSQP